MKFIYIGAILTIACRDQNKAKEACDKIINATKNKNVFYEILDLADLNSIRSFVQLFLSKTNRLDILINNAGIHLNLNINFEVKYSMFAHRYRFDNRRKKNN